MPAGSLPPTLPFAQTSFMPRGRAYALGAPDTCPVVLTMHGFEWFSPVMSTTHRYTGLAGAYRRWAERRLIVQSLSKSAAIVSIAGPFGPSLMGPMLKSKPIRYIPNPLMTDGWLRATPHHDDGRTVLCVGLITGRKNQMALVKLSHKSLTSFPTVSFGLPAPRLRPSTWILYAVRSTPSNLASG